MTSLETRVEQLEEDIAVRDKELNSFMLLYGATIIFFMQAGFAMLEAGSVRYKNTKNILVKNALDACLGSVLFFALGYGLAFGDTGEKHNPFIGVNNFFLTANDGSIPFYSTFLFQWAFSATTATIVSGAVAERCTFAAYLIYTSVLTVLIYPPVVHWFWSADGWLSAFKVDHSTGEINTEKFIGGNNFIDFAGSGVIHLVGGCAALAGAYFIGPRYGKFDAKGKPLELPGHSTSLQVIGTFILWFGWYGFNPISVLEFHDKQAVASMVAVNTTVANSIGGLASMILNVQLFKNQVELSPILNGILAGAVSVTAGCAVFGPISAMIVSVIGVLFYTGFSYTLLRFRIDDPLDASSVHGACGLWGVISVGLFADKDRLASAGYASPDHFGLFKGGKGMQLGIQVLGAVIITVWSLLLSGILFWVMNSKLRMLRVPMEDEQKGLDESHHGGPAYYYRETELDQIQLIQSGSQSKNPLPVVDG